MSKKNPALVSPTIAMVYQYNDLFDQDERYGTADVALAKLYDIFPKNNQLDDVFLKVVTLDAFYNTNVMYPLEVSKHILNIKPDAEMEAGSVKIVEDLAEVNMGTKTIRFYSFATKFCSWHNFDAYPIYDNFVEKTLWGYQSKDKYSDFMRKELKQYARFKEIVNDFRNNYGLGDFSYKQIDKFLWYYGKIVY